MKVLQVGLTDSSGRRFNGHDLHLELLERGHQSTHLVLHQETTDPGTESLLPFRLPPRLLHLPRRIESLLSLQEILSPWVAALPLRRCFREADVVHFHIIQEGVINPLALPLLTRWKPSLWTLHDPWPLTGHCVHPFACTRWTSGCGACPDLGIWYPMRRDHTALMWKIKAACYGWSRFEILVASEWMEERVRRHPVLAKRPLHRVPFGLDLERFSPAPDRRLELRRGLGIPDGNFVLGIRATEGEFKGLDLFKRALGRLGGDVPVSLLAFYGHGTLEGLGERFQLVPLGWTHDVDEMVRAYRAMDVFVMPSMAESFGMMAVEAMACGTPVIAFEGTAVEAVTGEGEGAMLVSYADADALAEGLRILMDEPDRRRALAQAGRELAARRYSKDDYLSRLLSLYERMAYAPAVG